MEDAVSEKIKSVERLRFIPDCNADTFVTVVYQKVPRAKGLTLLTTEIRTHCKDGGREIVFRPDQHASKDRAPIQCEGCQFHMKEY